MSTMTLNDVRRQLASWYGGSEACLDVLMCDEVLGPMIAAIDARLASYPVEPTTVASSETGNGGDKVLGESVAWRFIDKSGYKFGWNDGKPSGSALTSGLRIEYAYGLTQPKPEQADHVADSLNMVEQAVGDGVVVATVAVGRADKNGMRSSFASLTEEGKKLFGYGIHNLYATPRPAVATPADSLSVALNALEALAMCGVTLAGDDVSRLKGITSKLSGEMPQRLKPTREEWEKAFVEGRAFRDNDPEARYVADGEHLNCPSCGGSGHIDDVATPAEVTDELIERFKVAARALVRERRVYGEDVETMHDVLRVLEAAAAALASPRAGAVVPEGLKLMPKKLDENMRKAFELAKQWTESPSAVFTDGDVDHIYNGLLAAAPEVP